MARLATVRIRKVISNVPSWVPQPDFAKRIPTSNRINDASIDPQHSAWNPFGAGSAAPWMGILGIRGINTESSFVYAPDYGTHGAIVMHGGGHADYGGNEVYVVQLSDTPFFERLTLPYETCPGFISYSLHKRNVTGVTPQGVCGMPIDTITNDPALAESFGFSRAHMDWCGTEPLCGHQYAVHQVITAAQGGGSKGTFLRLACPAPFTPNGNFSGIPPPSATTIAHAFNLDTKVWTRFTTSTPAGISPSSTSWMDASRNRVNALFTNSFNSRQFLDLGTGVWTTQGGITSHVQNLAHPAAINHEFFDMGVAGAGSPTAGTSLELHAFPNAGGNWTLLNTTGTKPQNIEGSSRHIGLTYCPIDNAVYAFVGSLIWRCKPSASWTTQAQAIAGTWTWETLTPDLATDSHEIGWDVNGPTSRGVYNSVIWAPTLKSFACCYWNQSASANTWLNLALCLFRPDTAI